MAWKCPQCGENNPDTARMCALCGDRRPEEKPQEVVVRAMGPAPRTDLAPLPPAVQPVRPSSTEGWERLPPNASAEERQRLAEEAARRILGPTAQGTKDAVGCGTLAMFVMFLPWSLFLLPMKGGLRNKKAGQVLLVIVVVVSILSIVFGGMAAQKSMPAILKLMNGLKNSYNVDPGN